MSGLVYLIFFWGGLLDHGPGCTYGAIIIQYKHTKTSCIMLCKRILFLEKTIGKIKKIITQN